jgi:hypothetical protein
MDMEVRALKVAPSDRVNDIEPELEALVELLLGIEVMDGLDLVVRGNFKVPNRELDWNSSQHLWWSLSMHQRW